MYNEYGSRTCKNPAPKEGNNASGSSEKQPYGYFTFFFFNDRSEIQF